MPALAWQRLGEYLLDSRLLGSIQSTLYWDQNTVMPHEGASWRADQLSLIAKQLHARQSSAHFETLLAEAKTEFEGARLAGTITPQEQMERQRNLHLLTQEFNRQKSLDPKLVGHLAIARSDGYHRWQEARKNSDFHCFAPALASLVSLRQEEARQLAEPRSCWETLAQPFEPDLTCARLKELFDPLRTLLPELVDKVCAMRRSPKRKWELDQALQKDLAKRLLDEWGRDESITCVAQSPHPFSTTLGPRDFRLTTRIVKGQPLSSFLATAHEWGHSLYEQGLPSQSHQWFGWPLGLATSMGVHESQSLFWENRVARSKSFSQRWWTRFAQVGAPIDSAMELWHLMNPLTPGLNRVEADELSYGLHILIRTDLEIALLEDGLEVEALPSEWNYRYKEFLGISPANDREGCLQDVHWSEGLFGYFPSYLLGHLISAQLAEAMTSDFKSQGCDASDPLEAFIFAGEETRLLNWLRSNVHCHGRQLNAEQLVQKVTGRKLSSTPFVKYLLTKLQNLGL